MSLYEDLLEGNDTLSVIGLGYVGMPIAIAFAKEGLNVIGYDVNSKKVDQYRMGIDPTGEVGSEVLKNAFVEFSCDESDLKRAKFHIVAVPTPVNTDHTPDLNPVESAAEIVGRNLMPGSVVVFESTVYPGCTEDICIPILERESGMKCGIDFMVGYSPERINPGDKIHRLENICKVVSGINTEAVDIIAKVYRIVVKSGVFKASNIRTAEAIKVVENSQRDINIAFMNELAMVFDRMDIDTGEVIDGMNTKWNSLGFRPGLVGGHCIGVDPYYFTYKAEILGYHSQIILSGRQVNDHMGAYVANMAVKKMVQAGQAPGKSRVAVLGLTFKENCPDIRNTKVIDIIDELQKYGINPIVSDPWADREEVKRMYNLDLVDFNDLNNIDCLILAVSHSFFREKQLNDYMGLFRKTDKTKPVLVDVKNICSRRELDKTDLIYYRL